MSKKVVVLAAMLGALLVLGLTLVVVSTGPRGALLAARNTARFSSLVFTLALLAPAAGGSGDSHLLRFSAHRLALMRAFVAAHLVHYAAVFWQTFINPQAREHLLSSRGMVVLTGGLALVLVIGCTAAMRNRAQIRWNGIAVSLASLAFLLALTSGVIRGHRIDIVLVVFLAATIAVRLQWRFGARRRTAEAPGTP